MLLGKKLNKKGKAMCRGVPWRAGYQPKGDDYTSSIGV